MKVVRNSQELAAMIGDDGFVTEPVQTINGGNYSEVSLLKSFKNVHMVEGNRFEGLFELTSFEDAKLKAGCEFRDLESVVSFKNVKMAKGNHFHNLENLESFDGAILNERCQFVNLFKLVSFGDCKIPKGCLFTDMYSFPNVISGIDFPSFGGFYGISGSLSFENCTFAGRFHFGQSFSEAAVINSVFGCKFSSGATLFGTTSALIKRNESYSLRERVELYFLSERLAGDINSLCLNIDDGVGQAITLINDLISSIEGIRGSAAQCINKVHFNGCVYKHTVTDNDEWKVKEYTILCQGNKNQSPFMVQQYAKVEAINDNWEKLYKGCYMVSEPFCLNELLEQLVRLQSNQ